MFLSILSVLFVGVLAPTNIVASVLNRNTEPNMRLGRVYGGVQAEPNQFPHHVGILINGHYTCGGSIIASNAILTAAHCISGRENLPTEIIAGTTDHTEPKIKREVSQKIRHENYTTKYIVYEKMKFLVDTENDIALLILDEPLEFNEIVKKIELEAEDLELGSEVIIIGWGHSNESPEDLSQHLKFNENFKVTNKENCSLIPSLIPATDDRLCLTRAKGNGACDGDSGSSAVSLRDGKLVGIASSVLSTPEAACASPNADGFTKVSHFIDWIEKKLMEIENQKRSVKQKIN